MPSQIIITERDVAMNDAALTENVLKLRLETLLASSCTVSVPQSKTPLVSAIIPVHGKPHLLLGALEALALQGLQELEVIIVDNASDRATSQFLARVTGAHILQNTENQHFLQSANQGAQIARGEYLLFLNSDTFVCPGSISNALQVFTHGAVGVVGALLLNTSLTIQEYGGAILPNASTTPRNQGSPYTHQLLSRPPLCVDYCSAAFMLTPRSLFREMNGFDPLYRPAYYEDVDYCFRLSQRGLSTVVDPTVVALHVGRGSADSSNEVDRQINLNQINFFKRHEEALRQRWELVNARPSQERPSVVFIDDVVPQAASGQGQGRAQLILETLVNLGYEVSVYPVAAHGASDDGRWKIVRPASGEMREELLERLLSESSVVIVSRPANMELVYDTLSRTSMRNKPRAHIIYDSEALQSRREMMRLQVLQGISLSSDEIIEIVTREVAVACAAEQTLAVSPDELSVYRDFGFPRCSLLSYGIETRSSQNLFAQRRGFLFVGSLAGDDGPNSDSLSWFMKYVHPELLKKLSSDDAFLHVVGEGAGEYLRNLQNDHFMLLGALRDLAPVYDRYRVFVAPTRFSAGISLKIVEAAASGIPIVASSLVASQLGWSDEKELLVARNDREFTEKCARLYTDEKLWNTLRSNALQRVSEQFSVTQFQDSLKRIMALALA